MTSAGARVRSRFVVVGTGAAGRTAVETIASRDDTELVGWVTTSNERVGTDAAELSSLGRKSLRLSAAREIRGVLADGQADAMLYAGINQPSAIVDWLSTATAGGVDCVSVAGPVHPEIALGRDASIKLDERAREANVRLLSTGVNPGLLLDVLPLACASLSPTMQITVRARRRSEIRDWGASVLTGYGVGQSPEGWRRDEPYVSLRESAQMLLDGLDYLADEVIEYCTPIVSTVRRQHGEWVVEPETIAGFDVRCEARRSGEPLVNLSWTGEFCIDQGHAGNGYEPSHEIAIQGDLQLECRTDGTFLTDPYPPTIGRALNALQPLRSLPPGLYRPDQVPLSSLSSPGDAPAPVELNLRAAESQSRSHA